MEGGSHYKTKILKRHWKDSKDRNYSQAIRLLYVEVWVVERYLQYSQYTYLSSLFGLKGFLNNISTNRIQNALIYLKVKLFCQRLDKNILNFCVVKACLRKTSLI